MNVAITHLEPEHFKGVIELQRLAFPPPFDETLLWREEHLQAHIDKFPLGQFVAVAACGKVVGSCSNTLISRDWYDKHLSWNETVGGYFLDTFEPSGSVVYGLDISVHPEYRLIGVGRAFYEERKNLVVEHGYEMYATACRIPDFQTSGYDDIAQYCEDVRDAKLQDRTLSPLLRYNLSLVDVLKNYMDDAESGDAAALLEWRP